MVFNHKHQPTTNLGWDDTDAYMNQMMEEKISAPPRALLIKNLAFAG
jgi:hypothetical protein